MHPSPVARLFDEQPHHPQADRSPTLAARYYVDPDVFEAERDAIFVIDAARNEWSEHALHRFHRQYLEHMAARSAIVE